MRLDLSVDEQAAPLREAWYYAVPSTKLRRGKMLAKIMLGEPVLLGRDRDGAAFALRDLCPHRAMPLSWLALWHRRCLHRDPRADRWAKDQSRPDRRPALSAA